MIYINNKNKIEKFKKTRESYCIFLDYDRTITTAESDDSWAASANRKVVGDVIADNLDILYEKYSPIELDYTLDIKEKEQYMIEWYQKCMDLYHDNNLTKEMLNKSIEKSNIILRKGVKEFLLKLYKENISVILLSAGIGNVIEKVLKDNKCYYPNIKLISNIIKFDQNGKILKFKEKMLHTLNKNIDEFEDNEVDKILKDLKYRVVIGDLIEDLNMVGNFEESNVIKLAFLNKNIDKNLQVYNNRFDIVYTNDDANFEEVSKALNINING